jgi:N-methylhydantoinase A/oxoprolinase/acetone carboxylase beta subunit
LGRPADPAALSARESAVLEALREGPLSRSRLTGCLRLSSPTLLHTENLESLGYVLRSALTPTDILHARGDFTAWSVEAAQRGLELLAHLHGTDAQELADAVMEKMVDRLCAEVLRRHLGDEVMDRGQYLAGRLLTAALHEERLGPLEFSLRYHRPLLAVGAPAQQFFPEVARRLRARVVLPPYAEVANAIGAVAGNVVAREQGLIRPEAGEWILHWRGGRRRCAELEEARAEGERLLREAVVEEARAAGADDLTVESSAEDRGAHAADGQRLLIEVRLEATAVGRPRFTS